jgi:hypothetical protein
MGGATAYSAETPDRPVWTEGYSVGPDEGVFRHFKLLRRLRRHRSGIYFCPPKSQRSVSSHFSQKYTGSDLLRESIIGPVQLGHSLPATLSETVASEPGCSYWSAGTPLPRAKAAREGKLSFVD